MEEITNIAAKAFEGYYKALNSTGYMNYDKVGRIIILSLIEELLTGYMRNFITDEDYRTIISSLSCLGDNCLISFPNFKTYAAYANMLPSPIRINQEGIIRTTDTTIRSKV